MACLKRWLKECIENKGRGALVSTHEIAGVLAEESREVLDALRANALEEFKAKLLDLAVACGFGVAWIESERLDGQET